MVLHGIWWYSMVLHGNVWYFWYCMLLNGIQWYWIILYGIYGVWWYWMVINDMRWYWITFHCIALHGIQSCLMLLVLYGFQWYGMVLYGIRWYWMVLQPDFIPLFLEILKLKEPIYKIVKPTIFQRPSHFQKKLFHLKFIIQLMLLKATNL